MRTIKLYLLILLSVFALTNCGDDNPVTPTTNPQITSISSSALRTGDNLIITGKNFGTTQGTSLVYFNNIVAAVYSSWSDTEIKLIVPAITASGEIKVVVNSLESNKISYSIDISPNIISAGSGKASIGEQIKIIGENFGTTKGTVEFNSVPATDIASWTNTNILVMVPEGATTGNLIVKAGGKSSNPFYFTIATATDPIITSVSPNNASVGDQITIFGNRFGDTRGSSYVDINGVQATEYISWSNTSIKIKVPTNASTGPIRVYVGTQASNTVQFTLIQDTPIPVITSLSKTIFKVGDVITINGQNFGASKTEFSNVLFNGKAAIAYTLWQDKMITVTVPSGVVSGNVYVENLDKVSNGVAFTIDEGYQPPSITAVNPIIAPSGSSVVITGSHFGTSASSTCFVMFGNYKAETTQWSQTQITATVPEMPSGAIQVFVSLNGTESNKVNFTVQSKAVIIVPMVEIPAGTFLMGNADPLKEDAYPQHKVTFSKALLVAKTEISQAQYKKVMNLSNPSAVEDDSNPVEQLTFYQACDFCNRLSKLEGLSECYTINGTEVTWNKSANGYRLLTEAEWEYACRAGSNGSVGRRSGSEGNIDDLAWTTNNTKKIQHVGLKKPNDFGLYDMHGNVAEWVWDLYDFYEDADQIDPTGPTEGVERCFRGGAYKDTPQSCYSYIRNAVNGQQYQYYIGFRICRNK